MCKWLKLWLSALIWLIAVVFLWLPGLGNVSVPHADYEKQGYGMLCYYVHETQGDVVLYKGIKPGNLAITLLITVVISVMLVYDTTRFVQEQRSMKP
jgi:hypothetical protein